MSEATSSRNLTLMDFFSMTAIMIASIYIYPVFAASGLSLIFYLLLGGIFFFTPIALCAAEMATISDWESGGVFTWVSNTLGERWGFLAIFFQWFQVTIGFVTLLYFIIGSLSYTFQLPALASNPYLKYGAILIIFWMLTFFQLGGVKKTAKFTQFALIFGVLIPTLLLILLGIAYVLRGGEINIIIGWRDLVPNFDSMKTLVIMVSFILGYSGIEASAPHIKQLENPNRNYPLALFMIVAAAVILNTLGSLAIAVTIPLSQLNFSLGVDETFKTLILDYGENYLWIVRIISAALALGMMGEISAWLVGPLKGMQIAAEKEILPKIFAKTDTKGVPVPLLILQGVFISFWAGILTLGGGGHNLSYLVSITLTILIYLITYILFFSGYFILILKYPTLKRSYQISGGNKIKYSIAGSGIIMTITTFIISFLPPSQVTDSKKYLIILISSFLLTFSLPLLIYHFRRKN